MPDRVGNILARWQARLDNVNCSPLEFFEMVQLSVLEKELPNLSFSQITRNEGGWFSPQRIYLRIRCQKLFFDVSAFIVGDCLIVGWYLHEDASGVADLLAEIPGFGLLMKKTTHAATYYKVDFIEHFQRTVHESILRIIDELSEENGLQYLPDEARQPIWEEIW
jgi:hypothetical protein